MSGNSSSEVNSESECCDETCCPNHKLHSRTTSVLKKSLLLAAVLAAVSLSIALWLRIARFESRRFVLGIDDQRTLWAGDGDFSTMFCSEYDLDVTSTTSFGHSTKEEQSLNHGPIGAYIVLEGPRLYMRYIHSREYTIYLSSPSEYMYWAYQLGDLEDLYLHVVSSSCSNLTMFVIQEKYFFQWMEDSRRGLFCLSCIYETYHFPCSTNITNIKLRFSHYEYSEYIFLFQDPTLSSNSSLVANINFTLFRENLIIHDDHVVSACRNATHCRLSVPKAADTIIFQTEAHSPSSSVTLATGCVPRVEIYFAFFFAAPLAVWLILVGLIWSLGKCQEDVLLATQNADNAQSMARLRTGPPPAYSHPQTSAHSRTRSAFSIFARGTPRQQQLPLIDYEVTSEESEGVSRSPPAYGTIHSVSIPSPDPRRESMFEVYASTPPPNYTDTLSRRSQDANNAETTA